MPEGGLLFANDHPAGRTFIFDLRDPLSPKVAASFTDMGGYSHPHSFVCLPNGPERPTQRGGRVQPRSRPAIRIWARSAEHGSNGDSLATKTLPSVQDRRVHFA
jgi:hypothetical protein